MTTLTDRQRKQVDEISSSTPSRIDERLERLQRGAVVDHRVPSSYRGVAMKTQKVAVCQVYRGEIEAACGWFQRATETYEQAATAAIDRPPFATSYRRVPMTLLETIYAAACGGAFEQATAAASKIFDLDPTEGVEDVEGDIVFEPDKYYLARCVSSILLDRIDDEDLERLEALNSKKPEPHRNYGTAVLEVVRGIDSDDRVRIEHGIQTAIEYHERRHQPDDVIAQIMAVEATALTILINQLDYEIDVDHDLLPTSLIELTR